MLDAIVKKCREHMARFYYVGDMPDDMFAAARSETNFIGIGMLLSAPDKESLKRELMDAGADHIIDNFGALKEIIF
jgi:phosphoglycolate phosphatase-like HAD superfamily hydrolase